VGFQNLLPLGMGSCQENNGTQCPYLPDGVCDTDNPGTDYRLNPTLRNNGGYTETHALLSGSPAIDAVAGCSPTTDQRGMVRPQNINCDLGAFEWDSSIPQLIAPTSLQSPQQTASSITLQWDDTNTAETNYIIEPWTARIGHRLLLFPQTVHSMSITQVSPVTPFTAIASTLTGSAMTIVHPIALQPIHHYSAH
jgi:hypothetical protein